MWERMAWIKCQRCQYRVNHLPEMIVHPFLLRLAKFVVIQNMDAGLIESRSDFCIEMMQGLFIQFKR